MVINGRTEAAHKLEVRAETGGILKRRPVEKGQQVAVGDVLCEIDPRARQAKLVQAEANLRQAAVALESGQKLVEKGFQPANSLNALQAAFDGATAAVAEAELEMERAVITSPVSGIVMDPVAEVGDLMNVGSPCVAVIDLDPIKATGQVPERAMPFMQLGMAAEVRFINNVSVPGKVTYLSEAADPQTRTFRVEIEIANPTGLIKDGLTAVSTLQLPGSKAHRISPNILTLNDAGEIGVRTLNEENTVVFNPVMVLGDSAEGMWVGGLPDEVTVITVGHEYVVDGQTVEPAFETAELSQ